MTRHVGALLLGGVVGLAAVAVHRTDALGVPVGLLVAAAASVVAAWHLRHGDAPRTTATYCVGWVLVLGVVLAGRPEGDYALAGDVRGYGLMGVGFVLVALGVASLAARPVPPPT